MGQLSAQLFLICALSAPVIAASVPTGYEKIPWGTELKTILKKYPKGVISKTGDSNLIYRQKNPTAYLSQRLFGFKDGKLNVVSTTFGTSYVKGKGIENILLEKKKLFGECVMDTAQAPHMLNCIWENDDTRITIAYAPKRPDMTILMYDRKPQP
jgi:hypothetical protein